MAVRSPGAGPVYDDVYCILFLTGTFTYAMLLYFVPWQNRLAIGNG